VTGENFPRNPVCQRPEPDRLVVTGGEQRLAVRANRDRPDDTRVAGEAGSRCAVGRPDLHGSIVHSGQHNRSLGECRQCIHSDGRVAQCSSRIAFWQGPDFTGLVPAAGEQRLPIGTDRQSANRFAVGLQGVEQSATGEGPEFDGFVGASGKERFAVRAEG